MSSAWPAAMPVLGASAVPFELCSVPVPVLSVQSQCIEWKQHVAPGLEHKNLQDTTAFAEK